jgi:hypothetical protein
MSFLTNSMTSGSRGILSCVTHLEAHVNPNLQGTQSGVQGRAVSVMQLLIGLISRSVMTVFPQRPMSMLALIVLT